MKFHTNMLLNPWFIFCAWLGLWIARFQLIPSYYQRTWELGYYPPEADTIAIPIMAHAGMTIILAPVFAFALWLLLRRSSKESRKWLAWNRKRWILSLVWTLLFGALALLVLPTLAEDSRIGLYLNAMADVGWFFLWLALRAVVVSRISSKENRSSPNQTLQAAPVTPAP